ncbi:MAG: hypothetical protein KAI66_27155, partial [Lentisphaeria bacterium]|nr:hypothetical protein [Lentisphaeria bacterium]
MHRILNISLALLFALSSTPLRAADSALPEGVTKDELRAEILRRQSILLTHDASDVLPLMTELAGAKKTYGKLAGEYLIFFRNVLEQVYVNEELLTRMEDLHKEHEQLKKDAEREGVLLSDEIAREV